MGALHPAELKSDSLLLRQLPPFPAVAARLIGLVAAPQVSFREVAEVVRCDAAFTARVLRLVNSPLIGGREVSSILQALSILGSDRLNALVMTLAVYQIMGRDAAGGLPYRCWRHSVATACLSEMLALPLHLISETAYTAGLLHDIGCLAMARTCPDEYLAIAERVRTAAEQLDAERALFGVDHAELGAQLLRHWQLPPTFAVILRSHHALPPAKPDSLLELVQWADQLANQIGFSIIGIFPEDGLDGLPNWLQSKWQSGQLTASVMDQINRLECSLL